MFDRYHRWYDRQPHDIRFMTFMLMMVIILFVPINVWMLCYFTAYRFDMWVGLAQMTILLTILLSILLNRMLYIHRGKGRV